MSLMHRALDQTARPSSASQPGFNPLRRITEPTERRWWILAGTALLLCLVILVLPFIRPTSVSDISSEPSPKRPLAAKLSGSASLAQTQAPATKTTVEGTLDTPVALSSGDAPIAGLTSAGAKPANVAVDSVAEGQPSSPSAQAMDTEQQNKQLPETPTAMQIDRSTTVPSTAGPKRTVTFAQPISSQTSREPKQTAVAAITPESSSRRANTEPGRSVSTAVTRHNQTRLSVQTAISDNQLDRAERLLKTWADREPNLEEPRIWLAKLYLSTARHADASALLAGQDSVEALGLRGLLLEKSGNYADAARVFETLTRDDSSNPEWWLHWAINLENSGRLAEAQLLYQTYLQQFFSHSEGLTAFATERYRALAG